MKVVKIVIGIAAGIYAVIGVIQFVRTLLSHDAGTAFGASSIAAAVAPPCIGAVVAVLLLRSAFARPKPQAQDGDTPGPPNP